MPECQICAKPLGHDTITEGFTTCHEHRMLDTRSVLSDTTETVELEPATNVPLWSSSRSDELNTAYARIHDLEKDLTLIEEGRLAAIRALQYEKQRARELAANGMLTIKEDWVALANEMAIFAEKPVGGGALVTRNEEERVRAEGSAIDFVNRLRMGALADLETVSDEILVVKARAYEVWAKACNYLLSQRSIKVKISERDKFEEKKTLQSQERVKVAERKEQTRRRTPEEKLMEELTKLLGPDAARAHFAKMQEQAAAMLAESN